MPETPAPSPRLRTHPLVIAHRGASGERPEHTLEAYSRAIAQGADFIEPDLVPTRDGVLVCRHENALAVLHDDGSLNTTETSTDVYRRADFASRLATKVIDGRPVRGWFSEDFTLSELRTLRAVERLPALRPDNARWNGQFAVPAFREVLDLIQAETARSGRAIGVYPETKHPTYFRHEGRHLDGTPIGFDSSQAVVDALREAGFTDPARVFIQSFELANLRELATVILPAAGLSLPLIQLVDRDGAPYDTVAAGAPRACRELLSSTGLAEIARYAHGIGPHKGLVLSPVDDGAGGSARTLLAAAHAAGLEVHAWTFRAENHFLPAALQVGTSPAAHGRLQDEIAGFLAAGLDGLFSDFTAAAVAACAAAGLRPPA